MSSKTASLRSNLKIGTISLHSLSSSQLPTPTPISMSHSHHHLHHASTSSPSHTHPSSSAYSEIIPRLYISDLTTAESPVLLRALGVTHVLSAMRGTVHLPRDVVKMQVPLEDMPFAELASHLPTTCAWISDAMFAQESNVILVHCAEGISRSASVVAAFLMRLYGWTPQQALAHVRAKRRVADPNFGFVRQLGEYADVLARERGQIQAPSGTASSHQYQISQRAG